jgi:hypothetical protein
MSTPLHTLTIVEEPASLMATVKGVIAAREHVPIMLDGTSRGALGLELRSKEYPLCIAVADEPSIDAAVQAWEQATDAPIHKDFTDFDLPDDMPEDFEDSDPSDEDEPRPTMIRIDIGNFSDAHYKSALAIMGVVESPGLAIALASTLARTTGDKEFWANVIGVLFNVFPPPQMLMGSMGGDIPDFDLDDDG